MISIILVRLTNREALQKLMLSMGEPDLSRGIAQQIVGDSYRGHLVDVANNIQKVTIPTL